MTLYNILGITNRSEAIKRSKSIGISIKKLEYYNNNGIFPSGKDLEIIKKYTNLSEEVLMLRLGVFDHNLKKLISENADYLFSKFTKDSYKPKKHVPVYKTKLGKLYKSDCISFLKETNDDSFDLIFADPPFNLKKFYLSEITDDLKFQEYIDWTEDWLNECVRTLKPGGSLFLWNLPKWNSHFSAFLNKRLNFRHWIATDIKFSLPISGRLYPSHYSLLYYIKGEVPKSFHPDRLPMEICPKCFTDLKDYGGYKNKMNPKGINIADIWYDIPPVRHKKYKRREEANELSIKLLDRIIEMSTEIGDTVFDPFGGSGTTYIVSEIKKRKWVGTELGPIQSIVDRFEIIKEEEENLNKYRNNYNTLFTSKSKEARKKLGIWTEDSFK